MRRAGGLWAQVVAFENLLRAARNAARGKREVAGVARFLERLEPRLLALKRALAGQTWRPGRTASFLVRDPKERTITVAPFEDRVVHHALIDVLEPRLERRIARPDRGRPRMPAPRTVMPRPASRAGDQAGRTAPAGRVW